jgi:hypothetical protein
MHNSHFCRRIETDSTTDNTIQYNITLVLILKENLRLRTRKRFDKVF